jgi:phosphonate transport system permease protein
MALAALIAALALVSAHTVLVVDTDWERMGSLGAVLKSVARFLAIDFALIPLLLEPVLETFLMACIGTLVGAVLCIP